MRDVRNAYRYKSSRNWITMHDVKIGDWVIDVDDNIYQLISIDEKDNYTVISDNGWLKEVFTINDMVELCY